MTRWKPSAWGAVACMTGGILWILTLASMCLHAVFQFPQTLPFETIFRLVFASALPLVGLGVWTFDLPLILMVVGLVALYLETRRSLTVGGVIILALSAIGLVWAAWPNYFNFILGRGKGDLIVDFYPPQMDLIWRFESAEPGLVLFTISFILFALLGLENGALQRGIIIFLTESLIVMVSVSIAQRIIPFDARFEWLWHQFFAIVLQLTLFGIGWILLGFALLRGMVPARTSISTLAPERA